jgi:hypothetical protein
MFKLKLFVMRYSVTILVICCLSACQKNNFSPDTKTIFELCDQTPTDSAEITNKLQGSWILAQKHCNVDASFGAVKLHFFSNDSFRITRGAGYEERGTWHLKNVGINSWSLIHTDTSDHLKSGILFCNYEVLFIDSSTSQACYRRFVKCKNSDCYSTYR